MSTLNRSFEEAIQVTPQGSNKYSANLRPEWCIGTGKPTSQTHSHTLRKLNTQQKVTVPHGGYTTAVIYTLAKTHFTHAHPTQYKTPAPPISLQLSFLRRTAAGPATFEVEDVKLGARTSTIHIKLLQGSDKKPGKMETMVAGYITVSPPDAEVGINAVTGWKPYPLPPAGSRADGSVDLSVLGRTGRRYEAG